MIVITSTFPADVMRTQLIESLQHTAANILVIHQQIFSQLLLANSEFQQNKDGLNILLLRLSDLIPYTAVPQSPSIETFITEFATTIAHAHATMQSPLLILFAPTPAHSEKKTEFYTLISRQIQKKLPVNSTLNILHAADILQHASGHMIDSPLANQIGQPPYTPEFYKVLTAVIVEKISNDSPTMKTQLVSYPAESTQTILQNKIIAIFAEVLQIDPSDIGINTAFFDLGGTSLSAFNLIHVLNNHFHISIDFSILYIHATVKLLSEQIANILSKKQLTTIMAQTQQPKHALQQIKAGKSHKLPLVFIHPAGGTGCCYLDLIKALPEDQPCYLIQDPSMDAHHLLFDDMVSIATYYNHLLLKNLSSTPFVLAGYAFGGLLALEMIRQLERKNLADCVHGLITFDTHIPLGKPYDSQSTQVESADLSWMATYYQKIQDIGMAYTPSKISKKIVSFQATHQIKDNTPGEALNLYTSDLKTYFIDCDHHSILKLPHIQQISHLITQYIQELIHGMA